MSATLQPNPAARRRAILIVTVLGLAWSAVAAGDWLLRFRWFQWQRSWVQGAARPRYLGDARPLHTNQHPASVGGDLSALVHIPEVMARYAQLRPEAYTTVSDEFGLPNEPPTTNRAYDVVVVGDSYLLHGGALSNRLAGQLEARLGRPVYTVAHPGRGPIFPLTGYLDHPNFRARPPRVVVWELIERDIAGVFFEGMLFEVMRRVKEPGYEEAQAASGTRIAWSQLGAARLRASLPDTSAAAQLARRAWTDLRYLLFRQLPSEVIESTGPVLGQPTLFYRESIAAARWTPEVRDVPRIAWTLETASSNYFRPHGIQLVLLLIPDKETVYRDALPASVVAGPPPLQPTCLPELAERLEQAGLPVVNLLPAYQQARSEGRLTYWPDDTHWNGEGIRLAAELLARRIGGMVGTGEGSYEPADP